MTPRRLMIAAVVVVLLVAGALVATRLVGDDSAARPTAFYATPTDLPDAPGRLLRKEELTQGVPDGARGWRILYTTTRADQSIGVASGLVVVPGSTAPADGFPVIAWSHSTTGVARKCAPSLQEDPFGSGLLSDVAGVLSLGWAVVATDYPGLGAAGTHPYLVGRPEAWSELDAVRAARELSGATLGDQTVAWGHSQGGSAALWVGLETQGYAPDVPISGVAALAPASDLVTLAAGLRDSGSAAILGPYLVSGFASAYPDVSFDAYVSAEVRPVVRRILAQCLADTEALDPLVAELDGQSVWGRDPTTGPLRRRLQENTPASPSGVPTFVGQGESDELVPVSVQDAFVARLCRAGQPVDYHHYPGLDHTGIITDPDSTLPDDLVAWTTARFADEPAPTVCSSTSG